ncbi:C4-dicarboxylate transport sensor protein DctB [Brevundimonas sp. SH203]|uniref:sensor histidine kinase n=1 Tax=Brevundimonas sp. SH203 TaxID=345167 RepID=UPI0009CEAABB|nr:cache domain-containing protein [Brevundimonas sp. SH203]GAW40973.1 C4-dicarboxylate transport sensor protein DctB [Brevundimonas sp. SH203]
MSWLSSSDPARQKPARTNLWLGLAVCIVVAVLAAVTAGEVARRDAEAELARQAQAAAALHAAVLRSELEKHRSLPLALSGDPDIASLLKSRATAADAVNAKLEGLARQTRAAAIYVIDAGGRTRAASNWRLPTSFVGADYGFRPYFINAMRSAQAEFFALGTVSGRPGLYLARRVDAADGAPLGVVVVKVEFDALEAEWRASGEPAYVVDPTGVVLITSVPDWRFRTLDPLDETRRRLTLNGQTLRPEALRPLPFDTPANDRPRLIQTSPIGGEQRWMHAAVTTDTPGWTLHLLSPSRGAVEAAVASARALAALIVTLLAGLAAVLLRRRQQALIRARAEEDARHELERRIDERTRELSNQIEERRRAEAARERLRDELVQASKLAALGQIVASVAHEINQPVAAIQTQAETAAVLLDRQDAATARTALSRIGDLTQRIGAITEGLRTFSRKTDPKIGVVRLENAIHGALLLTRGRLDEGGVALIREGDADVAVRADRFRLEQVIVNLVKNAAEALEGRPGARLTLRVERSADRVRLIVADNGPGVPDPVRAQLFTPFVTTRANGLGLGLVICRDLVAGFGGELDLIETNEGATFVATLRTA